MVEVQKFWDVQNSIGQLHKATMAANSLITFGYLIRYPSLYFNLRSPSNPSSFFLTAGFFVMPFYYLLESYTTVNFCKAFLLYTCKYIIHHLLTISLMLTVFQHNFFNLFTLMTPAVHGFMNLGFYYNKSLEYLLCTWYAGFTVAALVYFAWVAFRFPKFRLPALQVLAIGSFLAVNNFYTPELVEMCVKGQDFDLGTSEPFIHVSAFVVISAVSYRFSRSLDYFRKSLV